VERPGDRAALEHPHGSLSDRRSACRPARRPAPAVADAGLRHRGDEDLAGRGDLAPLGFAVAPTVRSQVASPTCARRAATLCASCGEIKYGLTVTEIEVVSMGLDRNQHQGLFGESFVRVLASAAGLIVSRPELDVAGDDFTISHKGMLGPTRHPKIDVQVKSWSQRRAVQRDGYWKYRMKARHFNELAGTDFVLPRFLVLVIVPEDCADYARTRHDMVELKHAAYWLSLRDQQPVNGGLDATVQVDVPVGNLLTVDTLHTLMWRAGSTRTGA